jgi:hypothetical protein
LREGRRKKEVKKKKKMKRKGKETSVAEENF